MHCSKEVRLDIEIKFRKFIHKGSSTNQNVFSFSNRGFIFIKLKRVANKQNLRTLNGKYNVNTKEIEDETMPRRLQLPNHSSWTMCDSHILPTEKEE